MHADQGHNPRLFLKNEDKFQEPFCRTQWSSTGSQGLLNSSMCLSSVSEEVQALAFHAEQLQLESLLAVGCLIKPVSSWGFQKLAKGLHMIRQVMEICDS